jgi:hypothetical protein
VQHQNRAGPFANDEVSFPMAHRFTGVGVVRPLRDGGFLGDLVPGRACVSLSAPGMRAGQVAPEPPCLLRAR